MKTKQLYTLLIIFAVLAAGILIQKTQRPAELAVEEYAPLELSFDKDSVEEIAIERNGDRVEIARREGEWKVASLWNARASQSKVDTFLKALRDARGELRGSSRELFKDFGIEDSGSVLITLSGSERKPLLELHVGSADAGPGSAFVRKKDSEAVYLAQADLMGLMGIYEKEDRLPQERWASTSLLEEDPEKLERLEIKRFKDGREILAAGAVKEGGAWKFLRPNAAFAPDETKIVDFVLSARTWTAEAVLDPKAQDYGFADPSWQLKAVFDGREKNVIAGKSGGKDGPVYLQAAGEGPVFKMPRYYFDNLDADDSRFFPANPLGLNTVEIESLVIRTAKKEHSFKPKEKNWPALSAYMQELAELRIPRLLLDGKVETGKNSVEISMEGKPPIVLEAGDRVDPDTQEAAARIRGTEPAFAIPGSTHKALFEDLDRLAGPEKQPS